MGLLVVEILDAVLHPPQKHISTGQRLGEIAFCAVSANEQVKGYGARLMNHAKAAAAAATSGKRSPMVLRLVPVIRRRVMCGTTFSGKKRTISCSTIRFDDGMMRPTRATMESPLLLFFAMLGRVCVPRNCKPFDAPRPSD